MEETSDTSQELPTETFSDELPDENMEVVTIGDNDQTALELRMYETILKQRTMALELSMMGARTRDGVFTAHSYIATATAGLLTEILRRQDTDNARALLGRLSDEAATKEHNAGTRQLL